MSNADKPTEPSADQPAPQSKSAGDAAGRIGDYVLTAKDAGWRSRTVYVLPMTLVPVDPPEPIPKDRPRKELPPTGRVWRLPPVFFKPVTLVPIDPPESSSK